MFAMKTPIELKVSLMQLASLLLHRDFLKLVLNTNHRFDQFPFVSELVERESIKALSQLKMVAKNVSDYGEFRKDVEIMEKEYIINIITTASAAIRSLADSICSDHVPKRLSSFTVSKDEIFLDKAAAFFDTDFGLAYSSSLSTVTSGHAAYDNYNVPSLYYFMGIYLMLRKTTSSNTNNVISEGLINHVLLRGRDYVLSGHPADLFAHDVMSITTAPKTGLKGIYIHDDALITKAAIQDGETPEGNYSTYYDFSELNQTSFKLVG